MTYSDLASDNLTIIINKNLDSCTKGTTVKMAMNYMLLDKFKFREYLVCKVLFKVHISIQQDNKF